MKEKDGYRVMEPEQFSFPSGRFQPGRACFFKGLPQVFDPIEHSRSRTEKDIVIQIGKHRMFREIRPDPFRLKRNAGNGPDDIVRLFI